MICAAPNFAVILAGLTWIADARGGGDDGLTASERDAVREVLARKDHVLKSAFGSFRIESEAVKMSDGDIVVIAHGGTKNYILILRIGPDGIAEWDETAASIRTMGHTTLPAIKPAPDGACFVSWVQSAPDGLFVRKIDSEGTEVWTKRVVDNPIIRYEITHFRRRRGFIRPCGFGVRPSESPATRWRERLGKIMADHLRRPL